MEQKEILLEAEYSKILVPAYTYNLKDDTRLLIPFTKQEKIGFVNRDGVVVVKPQYAMYYGECYTPEDFIKVAVIETREFSRSGGKISIYQYPHYGLINYKGETILEPLYYGLILSTDSNEILFTVESAVDYKWGVLNVEREIVVPFGKYTWIDGFDNGVARVIKDGKWGLIDECGNEVLPIEYDNIWNFYGKKRDNTLAFKENRVESISLRKIWELKDTKNKGD